MGPAILSINTSDTLDVTMNAQKEKYFIGVLMGMEINTNWLDQPTLKYDDWSLFEMMKPHKKQKRMNKLM